MKTINQSVTELVCPSASVPFYSEVKKQSIDQSVSLLVLSFVHQFVSKLVSHLVSYSDRASCPCSSMARNGQQRCFSNGKLNYFCSDRPVSQRLTVRENQLLVYLENNYSLTGSNGQAAVPLGSLSNKDDDGSEDIAKKIINLRPFKLFRVYLEPLNLSNVGDFSRS